MRPIILASAAIAVLLAVIAPPAAATAPPPITKLAPAAAEPERLTLPKPKAGRVRPLVAVVADNDGAETTDFIVPYGVLKESGVADVRSVSTADGPIHLFLTLTIRTDQTLAAFDAAEPAGADIVIVPAQMQPKNPALIAWLKAQAERGATIVSICEGARVLAEAGLLDGRRATTHWHAMPGLAKRHPRTTWVRDRRYVQDGPIISTTGVSASIPVSLALVEAIGGRPAATDLARRLGAAGWGAEHRTGAYSLTAADYGEALMALGAFWRRETLQAPLADGVDEVGLALQADAWSRTFRTKVVSTAPGRRAVRSRHGLVLVPDAEPTPGGRRIAAAGRPAVAQLDAALAEIRSRYGARAARLTRLGLEYAPAAPVRPGD